MRPFRQLVSALCIVLTASVWSQDMSKRLTNRDIVEMVKLGISDDIIIAKIRSMNGADSVKFDTGIDGLKALKAANVSDAVLRVMINPAPPPVLASAPGGTAVVADPNLPPQEIGLYWKDGPTFVFIGGQALSQAKAGGHAGSISPKASNPSIGTPCCPVPPPGTASRTAIRSSYFYVPDGASADDFVLLKLNRKDDRREFQIGTFGGIGAGKSGVKRSKELSFENQHVAIRTYKVTLASDLKAGEYAFFMGTSQSSMISSGRGTNSSGGAAAGRIYDFTVTD